MSPELFNVQRAQSSGLAVPTYDGFKVDTWAVGITLHILLRGDYPFGGLADGLALTASGQLSKDLLRKLKKSVDVSPDCTDFISQCLIFNPDERPTVPQLCAHKWLAGCGLMVRILCCALRIVLQPARRCSRAGGTLLPRRPPEMRRLIPPCCSTCRTSSTAPSGATEQRRARCAVRARGPGTYSGLTRHQRARTHSPLGSLQPLKCIKSQSAT